jgi:hypothetical protein
MIEHARWTIAASPRVDARWWAEWDCLNDTHLQSHPLLSSRWARNLVASFGSTELRFARLRLRDGQPLAAAILQPAGFGCWRVFCPAQAAVALLVFDRAAAQSTQCLQRLLRHLPGVGLVLDVPYQDGPYSWVEPREHACIHRVSLRTTIRISSPQGLEKYWTDRPKELRDNVRRRQRKANEEGLQLRLEAVTESPLIGAAVDRYGELESRGWKGREGTAVSPINVQGRFYRAIMEEYAQSGDACVFELWAGQRLAASRIVIRGPTMHVILKTTFDENLRNFAPGHLQLYEMLRTILADEKGRIVELYTKATRDWLLWATDTRSIDDISIYRSSLVANLVARRRRRKEATAAPTAAASEADS